MSYGPEMTPREPERAANRREFRVSPATHPSGVPRDARIFVNRHLRLSRIHAIGFDLDYTLASYRLNELDELAYRVTREKLVTERNHPEAIRSFAYDPNFVQRGLVLDTRRGNLLKMDYHNYVVRATHGTRPLSAAERRATYQARRVRTSTENYITVDTYFHRPEIYLYLQLVDYHEAHSAEVDHEGLYRDVRAMIDKAHADGSLKKEICADPAKYLDADPLLPEFLRSLREHGKRVFLLTNSEYFYTEVLLRHLIPTEDPDGWQRFFDLVVVDARKPRFFTRDAAGGTPIEGATETPIFSGGNVDWFENQLDAHGHQILYWGDHTYGDILRSKKSVGWRTAMIVPELIHEQRVAERILPDLARLDAAISDRDRVVRDEHLRRVELGRLEWLMAGSAGSAPEVRRDVLRKLTQLQDQLRSFAAERDRLHAEISSLDETCNSAYDLRWGPLFREGNELSRFAHQVRDFACIYTSRATNLLFYPQDAYFRAPMERMPHER